MVDKLCLCGLTVDSISDAIHYCEKYPFLELGINFTCNPNCPIDLANLEVARKLRGTNARIYCNVFGDVADDLVLVGDFTKVVDFLGDTADLYTRIGIVTDKDITGRKFVLPDNFKSVSISVADKDFERYMIFRDKGVYGLLTGIGTKYIPSEDEYLGYQDDFYPDTIVPFMRIVDKRISEDTKYWLESLCTDFEEHFDFARCDDLCKVIEGYLNEVE